MTDMENEDVPRTTLSVVAYSRTLKSTGRPLYMTRFEHGPPPYPKPTERTLYDALISAFRIASWKGNESLLTTLITEDGIEHDVNWKQLQALTLNAALTHYGVESVEDLREEAFDHRGRIDAVTLDHLTRSERKPMD
jgi:hypothetical protein